MSFSSPAINGVGTQAGDVCQNCAKPLASTARFCGGCGTPNANLQAANQAVTSNFPYFGNPNSELGENRAPSAGVPSDATEVVRTADLYSGDGETLSLNYGDFAEDDDAAELADDQEMTVFSRRTISFDDDDDQADSLEDNAVETKTDAASGFENTPQKAYTRPVPPPPAQASEEAQVNVNVSINHVAHATEECGNGHSMAVGQKFCGSCGGAMDTKGATTAFSAPVVAPPVVSAPVIAAVMPDVAAPSVPSSPSATPSFNAPFAPPPPPAPLATAPLGFGAPLAPPPPPAPMQGFAATPAPTFGRRAGAYQTPAPMMAGPMNQLPTNRGLLKFILLDIVTLGIYGIICMWGVVSDLNTVAARDGKRTPNLLIAALLGIVTLGIYPIIWFYKIVSRMSDELHRRGLRPVITTNDFWLWGFLGGIIAVGPFIFYHKLFKASNTLNEDYNRRGLL